MLGGWRTDSTLCSGEHGLRNRVARPARASSHQHLEERPRFRDLHLHVLTLLRRFLDEFFQSFANVVEMPPLPLASKSRQVLFWDGSSTSERRHRGVGIDAETHSPRTKPCRTASLLYSSTFQVSRIGNVLSNQSNRVKLWRYGKPSILTRAEHDLQGLFREKLLSDEIDADQ